MRAEIVCPFEIYFLHFTHLEIRPPSDPQRVLLYWLNGTVASCKYIYFYRNNVQLYSLK